MQRFSTPELRKNKRNSGKSERFFFPLELSENKYLAEPLILSAKKNRRKPMAAAAYPSSLGAGPGFGLSSSSSSPSRPGMT